MLLTPSGDRGGIHIFLFHSFKFDEIMFVLKAFSGNPCHAANNVLANITLHSYT